MLQVRHYPELVTPDHLELMRLQVGYAGGYDLEGQFSKWLVEDGQLPPWLEMIAAIICPGIAFQAVILRGYKDGTVTTPCHSDAGATGFCMILSLGATRTFRVHRLAAGQRPQALCANPDLDVVEIKCVEGTALLMDESFQESWHHQLAPDEGVTEERLSLVFRTRPAGR